MRGDRERCMEAGMDDYLSKPIRAADLFHKIAEVLARLRPAPQPDGLTAGPTGRVE